MRHHSQRDSCNCCRNPAAMLSCIHKYARDARVVVSPRACTRTYVQARTHARTHTYSCQYRITRGRDFFITVRADCIFLRLPTTGCPIWRIAWKEGHLITCSWQSCPASILRHPRFSSGHPFIPAPACPHPWTQSSSRENEEPFIRRL